MQRFHNFNYTQKHYKGPDDDIKPKLVARMLQIKKHCIYQKYCCALTEINIYIYIHLQFYNKHNGMFSIKKK